MSGNEEICMACGHYHGLEGSGSYASCQEKAISRTLGVGAGVGATLKRAIDEAILRFGAGGTLTKVYQMALADARMHGFRPTATPDSNLAAYAQQLAESFTIYARDMSAADINLYHASRMEQLIAYMAERGIMAGTAVRGGVMDQVRERQQKKQEINMTETKKTVQDTGGMLKDAFVDGSIFAACKKTNQLASDMIASLLREKVPAVDTAEGKLVLQAMGPVLAHFLCSAFPDVVPGAEKIAPLLKRAQTMAVTDGTLYLGDKVGDVLLPMVKELAGNLSGMVDKLPSAAQAKLKEEDESARLIAHARAEQAAQASKTL